MEKDQQTQGLLMECIYCSLIFPELKNNNCPVCKDKNIFFQPAQMMDKNSSQIYLMQKLSLFFQVLAQDIPPNMNDLSDERIQEIKDNSLSILNNIAKYNFDLQEALIDLIRGLSIKK